MAVSCCQLFRSKIGNGRMKIYIHIFVTVEDILRYRSCKLVTCQIPMKKKGFILASIKHDHSLGTKI